jgi:PAS domain S-box-containing protein
MNIRVPSRASAIWPWIGLSLALGLTTGGWWVVRRAERARLLSIFEEAVVARVAMISQRLTTEEQILKGAAEFVAQKDPLSRDEWRDYVSALDLPRRYPGVQGLGFIKWVPRRGPEAHERGVRAGGWPGFQVKPVGDLPFDSEGVDPVVFLEPMTDRNVHTLGVDVWSEPIRREALVRSRDLGEVSATRRIYLVQEEALDRQAGIILCAPVYRRGSRLDSLMDRRSALIGWISLPLRMDDYMQEIFGHLPAGLSLRVMEEGAGDAAFLFPSSPISWKESLRHWQGAPLIRTHTLEVAGQHWIILARADGRFTVSRGGLAHWGFLVAGSLVSLLVFMVLRFLSRSEIRAEQLADQRLEQLASSEVRWQFAIEGTGDGLWDWDVPAGKVFFSSRWKAMLGYEDGEIGDTLQEWQSRVHPEDLEATLEVIRKHLLGEETGVYQSEHRLRCKDGAYKWVLDRGMVMNRTGDGRAARMIGTHTDLTERRNTEAVLRRVEKAEGLGLMAAGIAHDFNNLFQALLGNLELAQFRSDPKGRQILDRARVALDRAAGLSRRLLDFSGGGITNLERVSLNPLIQEVAESLLHEDRHGFQLALDPVLPEVIADPQQIRQVLGILIENAVESIGPNGGTVIVTSEQLPGLPEEDRAKGLWEGEIPRGPSVCLSVSDTGGGAQSNVMTRLFDPFFSTKALGRGLGLSSALGLIRGNHAGLQVLNRPGEGMTFRVHLPVERRTEPRMSTPASPVRLEGRAVLLVDDETTLRQVLAEAIGERQGCTVFEAADGAEAIEVFQAHGDDIGLVLMDSVMPRMRGPEAFDEMRRIRPGIPGILMSGFSDETSQEFAIRHGFRAFLKKPFPFQELSSLMAELKFGTGESKTGQAPAPMGPHDP